MANAAEIPNFPIILKVVLTWTSDRLSPIRSRTIKYTPRNLCSSLKSA